uniref:dipeptidyl peptidase 2 n=1 Tax=Pristiophorus japonicus TaxID=55135 RepID=UPI00398E87E4
MKCGRPFSLLLLLFLPALSDALFIPPGLSPGQAPTDSTAMPSPPDATGAPVTSLIIEVAENATTTSSITAADTTTLPQSLQIQIDMEEITGNPTQADGGATEPVWHPYLIKITSDNGEAEITLPSLDIAATPTRSTPPPEEEMIIELPPSTEEAATTAATTTTAAPELIGEDFTRTPQPAKGTTAATETSEPIVVVELLETTPSQQQQSDRGVQLKFVSNKIATTHQSAPQQQDEGEPEKPKPQLSARKLSAKKTQPRAPESFVETNAGPLLPTPGEAATEQAETGPPQVYLVIKEGDSNSSVPQKQTEVPVTLQIISTKDLDLRTAITDVGKQGTDTSTKETKTTTQPSAFSTQDTASSTKGTATNANNTHIEVANTVISINDNTISVEETIAKKSAAQPTFKEKYFDQVIDHFSFIGHQKTYRQRYLVADEFWGKSFGPIFLYTGNEGDIWDFANNSRFLTELASEQKAMVIFAEHRYYGKSLPFGKKSYEKSNIEFLTVEQALADYAVLISSLKTNLNAENCPVIAFGGSYGGMLSAYMRIRYPNIVAGALASSAPVVSTANIGDGRQFFHDVTKDFEHNSPDCVSKIRAAFQELESLAQHQAWNKIASKLSLCKPMKSKKEVDHLYGWARNAFTYLAMFNYPYKTAVAMQFPPNPVDVACRFIIKKSDPIDGLLDILGMFYNSSGTKKCFDIYTEYIYCADPTGCGLGAASQAWDFQACTEINLMFESTSKTDMFPAIPFTEAMRRNYCHSKWGVYPKSEWLKMQYWGDDFKAASNIIFSNGDLDPWANGGILTDVNPYVVAFIIEGGAHHLDLRASNPADPPSVTAIRKKESSIIGDWVKKYQGHSVNKSQM